MTRGLFAILFYVGSFMYLSSHRYTRPWVALPCLWVGMGLNIEPDNWARPGLGLDFLENKRPVELFLRSVGPGPDFFTRQLGQKGLGFLHQALFGPA
jgi:hypothetical protein